MRKILVLLMCFNIVLAPTYLFAAGSGLGGWSLGSPVAQGASAVYDGTKKVLINGAEKIAKGTAKITPNAAQVAKVLRGGAYGYALSVAVEQLLGAVDWVLDPANNQIKYYPVREPFDPSYQWKLGGALYDSPEAACRAFWSSYDVGWVLYRVERPNAEYPACVGYNAKYNAYDTYQPVQRVSRVEQVPEQEEKKLPLTTVAQQVISNAESSSDQEIKAGAQAVTMAAAQDIVNEAENDSVKAYPIVQQLEQSKSYPVDNTATGEAATRPDVSNPDVQAPPLDLKLEFPAFCGWAPIVCEAAQTVISFPQTLSQWWETANSKADRWANSISEAWTTFREWAFSNEQLPENEKPDIADLPTPELKEDAIRWSAQCPADAQVPINLYGTSSVLTFSWSPWCQLLSVIKPAIIASAYIGAAFIVLGLRT